MMSAGAPDVEALRPTIEFAVLFVRYSCCVAGSIPKSDERLMFSAVEVPTVPRPISVCDGMF